MPRKLWALACSLATVFATKPVARRSEGRISTATIESDGGVNFESRNGPTRRNVEHISSSTGPQYIAAAMINANGDVKFEDQDTDMNSIPGHSGEDVEQDGDQSTDAVDASDNGSTIETQIVHGTVIVSDEERTRDAIANRLQAQRGLHPGRPSGMDFFPAVDAEELARSGKDDVARRTERETIQNNFALNDTQPVDINIGWFNNVLARAFQRVSFSDFIGDFGQQPFRDTPQLPEVEGLSIATTTLAMPTITTGSPAGASQDPGTAATAAPPVFGSYVPAAVDMLIIILACALVFALFVLGQTPKPPVHTQRRSFRPRQSSRPYVAAAGPQLEY